MINLRYHVFSLIAVFAALAIGIVVGTTTVKSGLVDSLRSNVDRAEERIAEVEQENEELARRDEQLDLLATEGAPLLADELAGEPVLWVTAPGVDGDVLEGLQESFDASGAVTIARIAIEAEVFSPDAATLLAEGLDIDSGDVDQLRVDLGESIALRVDAFVDFVETSAPPVTVPPTTVPPTTDASAADVPGTDAPGTTDLPPTDPSSTEVATADDVSPTTEADTTEPPTTEPDTTEPPTTEPPTTEPPTTTTSLPPPLPVDGVLLGQLGDLEDLGIIDLTNVTTEGLEPGARVRIVIVEDHRSDIDTPQVLLPFVEALSDSDTSHVAVVAEAGGTVTVDEDDEEHPRSLVQSIRTSGRLRDEVSTIDNAEDFPGWAATVLAVRNGIAGRLGHFGHGAGSNRLLPPPVP